MRSSLAAIVCAFGTTLSAASARAQDAAPVPLPSPEPPRIDVTGFVDLYYAYNVNKVDPALRTHRSSPMRTAA